MRRVFILAAALAALVVNAVAAGAPPKPVVLTPVARLKFPDRGFLLGVNVGHGLTARDVVVRENGQPVPNVSFVPASQSTQRFATMLLIDSSDSMRGEPLADAFAAARRFAQQLGANQEVGVMTFNSRATLVQKPTSDSAELASALAVVPRSGAGTHIYDALAEALKALTAAHASASSIILLSDGADTGSTTKEIQLATRAHRMRVRIFTIGLRSPTFRPGPLRTLSHDTGAGYAKASASSQLQTIYAALAQQLSHEYLLRYRSQAVVGANVVLTVKVSGVGGSVYTYVVPKAATVAPYHRSLFLRFWTSAASLLLISLIAALLAAGAVVALLKRQDSGVVSRIADFATLRSTAGESHEEKRAFSSVLFGGTERSLSRTRWWARIKEELELAEVPYSAEQLLAVSIIGTLFVGLLLYVISPVFCVFGLFVPFAVYGYCQRELRIVRRRFEDQLPDNLQVLASALRAGHSFVGALSVVAADASEPSKREFMRAVADEQLGVPLEDALREVARRMANQDLEQVALVAELQRQAGGNMAEVLDRVVETIRSRFDLRRLVRTLTAQGRLARWILTMLPVFLGGMISLVNPSYMAPLFTSAAGQVAVVIAGLMIIAGSYLIKRIVDIKV